jgi:hypothetical protein
MSEIIGIIAVFIFMGIPVALFIFMLCLKIIADIRNTWRDL